MVGSPLQRDWLNPFSQKLLILPIYQLIKRVKQGQGKPTIIYVKSFVIKENAEGKNNESLDFQKSKVKNIQNRKIGLSQMESPDFSKSEVKGFENEKFRVPKSKSQDFSKSLSG